MGVEDEDVFVYWPPKTMTWPHTKMSSYTPLIIADDFTSDSDEHLPHKWGSKLVQTTFKVFYSKTENRIQI